MEVNGSQNKLFKLNCTLVRYSSVLITYYCIFIFAPRLNVLVMGAFNKIAFLSYIFSPNGIWIFYKCSKKTYTRHCKHTYWFIYNTYYGRICKQLGTVMYTLWFVSYCCFFQFQIHESMIFKFFSTINTSEIRQTTVGHLIMDLIVYINSSQICTENNAEQIPLTKRTCVQEKKENEEASPKPSFSMR